MPKQEFYGITIVYGPTIFLVKLSILLLYLRIFSIKRSLRYLIWIGIASQILFLPTYTVYYIIQDYKCLSLAAQGTSFCRNGYIFLVVQATYNVLTDIYIILLPIPAVRKLQIPMRKKTGVIVIFAAGSIACIVSIIRLAWVARRSNSTDSLWNGARTTLLSAVEMNIALICASIPALPALFRQHASLFSLGYLRSLSSRSLFASRRYRTKNSKTSSGSTPRSSHADEEAARGPGSYVELTNTPKAGAGPTKVMMREEEDRMMVMEKEKTARTTPPVRPTTTTSTSMSPEEFWARYPEQPGMVRDPPQQSPAGWR